MKSSLGKALALPGFVTQAAAREYGSFLELRAVGKHLCGLQCSTVASCYPPTGYT